MLLIQHSHFNSPCKYTEMKAVSQMFFADLSRFHSILLDTSNILGQHIGNILGQSRINILGQSRTYWEHIGTVKN